MRAQIPPRKNRTVQREYDRHLYRQRHLVGNAFLHLKQWRRLIWRQREAKIPGTQKIRQVADLSPKR